MTERVFDNKKARRENFRTLVNWAGDLIKGEVVVVPVTREDYVVHIDPLVQAANGEWSIAEYAVHGHLRGKPLTSDEAESMGKDLASDPNNPATRWRSWTAQKIVGLAGRFSSAVEVGLNIINVPDIVGMSMVEQNTQEQPRAGGEGT